MKYISMKMDPKGSRPPMMAMTWGVRYHFFRGMGRAMVFTRQGLSGVPLQLRPTMAPMVARGREMNAQMMRTTSWEEEGNNNQNKGDGMKAGRRDEAKKKR